MSCPTDLASRWLFRLHTLIAGRSSAEETDERLRTVLPLLADRFPLEAFTQRSLEHVASHCKFWPSYAELSDLLAGWWRDNRPPPLALPAPPEPEPEVITDEQREAVLARFREMWSDMKANINATRPPEAYQNVRPLPDVTMKGEELARSRAARGLVVPESRA